MKLGAELVAQIGGEEMLLGDRAATFGPALAQSLQRGKNQAASDDIDRVQRQGLIVGRLEGFDVKVCERVLHLLAIPAPGIGEWQRERVLAARSAPATRSLTMFPRSELAPKSCFTNRPESRGEGSSGGLG
jgi:hypothetical protein